MGKKRKRVERRAATLPGYYRRELRKYDVQYHETGAGETGPLVTLLKSYGRLQTLVVGPWGNGSKDLIALVRTLAECRVAVRTRARGQEAPNWELGVVMGEMRRTLSLAFVRAEAICLLARMCVLGPGAPAAGKRRQQAEREEEVRRRVERAHFLAHVRGRGRKWPGEVHTA